MRSGHLRFGGRRACRVSMRILLRPQNLEGTRDRGATSGQYNPAQLIALFVYGYFFKKNSISVKMFE
jgi:hypothetical protein